MAPKSQKRPQNKSKSIVRIERNIENENFSTTLANPKTIVEPYLNPKNSPLGPKKSKMTLTLSQNQMSEL